MDIDTTNYVYRYDPKAPDGKGALLRTEPGLPAKSEDIITNKERASVKEHHKRVNVGGKCKYDWESLMAQAVKLYEQGMTLYDIAKELGIQNQILYYHVRVTKWGEPLRKAIRERGKVE